MNNKITHKRQLTCFLILLVLFSLAIVFTFRNKNKSTEEKVVSSNFSCGNNSCISKTYDESIILTDSSIRTFRLHVSSKYEQNKPIPLVLAFHGAGGDARNQEELTGLTALSDEEGFIIVYPNGRDKEWHGSYDKLFISQLLDKVEKDLNIDTSRVYATGMSSGGFFSEYLGCALPDRFAAIGVVAVTQIKEYLPCNAKNGVPIYIFHGTSDPIVKEKGGIIPDKGYGVNTMLSMDETLKTWREINGCSIDTNILHIPDLTKSGTEVNEYTYKECKSEMKYFEIINGGHTWPGGKPLIFLGKTDKNINASKEIWSLFLRHSIDKLINR